MEGRSAERPNGAEGVVQDVAEIPSMEGRSAERPNVGGVIFAGVEGGDLQWRAAQLSGRTRLTG